MHISSVLLLLALLGSAHSAAVPLGKRAVTAAQLTTAIQKITQISQDLQPAVSNIQSGDSIIAKRQQTRFQPLIDGLGQIVRTISDDLSNLDGTAPFSAAAAQPVCSAYSTFAVVNQELLKLVIGKSGLLESVFQGPVTARLRQFEEAVDTFSFGIINTVPSCEAAITEQKSSLDDTLGKAVCAYTPGGSLGLNLFC